MNILFVGDIVGRAGRRAVIRLLPLLREKFSIDFCIANAENAAGGMGLTPKIARILLEAGIDVLTSGNHIWDHKEIFPFLEENKRVLRPANYPPGVPGTGSGVFGNGLLSIGVINLSGRVFMSPLDCPFRVGMEEVEKLRKETPIIIVDFHAEATSEKVAVGKFLDGKVSAIIGTHTHVQTADETILPKGAAYITDVGMTGASNSIIGAQSQVILNRFLTQIPYRFQAARGGDVYLMGVKVKIEEGSGRAISISRLKERLEED